MFFMSVREPFRNTRMHWDLLGNRIFRHFCIFGQKRGQNGEKPGFFGIFGIVVIWPFWAHMGFWTISPNSLLQTLWRNPSFSCFSVFDTLTTVPVVGFLTDFGIFCTNPQDGQTPKMPKNPIFHFFWGVTSFGHFWHFWHFWLKKGQPQWNLVLQMTLLDIFGKRKVHVFTDFRELSLILPLLKNRNFRFFWPLVNFGQQTSNLKIFLTDFWALFRCRKTPDFRGFQVLNPWFHFCKPVGGRFCNTRMHWDLLKNHVFSRFFTKWKNMIFGDFFEKFAVLDQFWHRTIPLDMWFLTLNGIFVTCGPVWAIS